MNHLTARRYGVLCLVSLAACRADTSVSPPENLAFDRDVRPAATIFSSSAGTSVAVAVGDTITLYPSVRVPRPRSWSSSNTAVTQVSFAALYTGRVQAVGLGSSRVISRGFSSSVQDTTRFDVYTPVISGVPESRTLQIGQQWQLPAKVTSSTGVVLRGHTPRFQSSNTTVATVSSSGLITGVGSGSATITASDGPASASLPVTVGASVTSFDLTPHSLTLARGATQQFAVNATWSDLVVRPISASYSATGGSITVTGQYTAGQVAGTFMVIASCVCGRADTAMVSISSSTVTLRSLALSPKSSSVALGGSQQFTASGVWSDNSTATPPVTYAASAGTITAGGSYTPPPIAGTYRVIAAQIGGALADTATLTVLPANSALVAQDVFSRYANTAALQAVLNARNFYASDNINPTLASIDTGTKYNGGNSMMYTFPGGQSSSAQLVVPVRPLSNMWLRVKVRWSPGFTTTGTIVQSANAYKFLSWAWQGLNGRGEITITNTNEYQNLIDVFPPEYGQAGSRASIADYNGAGRIATEWSDGGWYDYIVHYEILTPTTSRQRFWVARDGQTPVLRATSNVTSYSDVPLPPINRVQLGRNFNQMRLPGQTMYLWYGQWEIFDGTVNNRPFGMN